MQPLPKKNPPKAPNNERNLNMLITETPIEVRYPDCDPMGIVHHAVYVVWYEIARMDFFKKMGFSYTDMNALGINPPMVDLHVQYFSTAKYPQDLTVRTSIKSYAKNKIELQYETWAEGGEKPINTAVTFHIWTGPDMRAYNMEEKLPEVYAKIKAAAGDN